jgi:hypothetical protein
MAGKRKRPYKRERMVNPPRARSWGDLFDPFWGTKLVPRKGWWQASDGSWYPPEQHPKYKPPPPPPHEAARLRQQEEQALQKFYQEARDEYARHEEAKQERIAQRVENDLRLLKMEVTGQEATKQVEEDKP